MNKDRIIKLFYGGVVAWILFVLTSLAWNVWLFPDLNAELTNNYLRTAENWRYANTIIFYLGLGFVFTFIYQYYRKETPPTLSGAMYGMLMGAVMGAPLAVYLPQFTFGTMAWPFLELIFTLFQGAIVGIAVAHTQGVKIKHIQPD